jgi:hypothetical protein
MRRAVGSWRVSAGTGGVVVGRRRWQRFGVGGNHATCSKDISVLRREKLGQAFSFNGTSSRIKIPASAGSGCRRGRRLHHHGGVDQAVESKSFQAIIRCSNGTPPTARLIRCVHFGTLMRIPERRAGALYGNICGQRRQLAWFYPFRFGNAVSWRATVSARGADLRQKFERRGRALLNGVIDGAQRTWVASPRRPVLDLYLGDRRPD